MGCEVLSGKDHVVERLADGNSFRITTTSGRKVLKGKTRIEEKNGKNTSEGGAEKKEKKEKKDKKKKKKEKKEKRVIDSKIAAAVTAELKARSEGAKPTAYKALRDKVSPKFDGVHAVSVFVYSCITHILCVAWPDHTHVETCA